MKRLSTQKAKKTMNCKFIIKDLGMWYHIDYNVII